MDLGLGNRNALILGGSRGIGFFTAELLADEGANVTNLASHTEPGSMRTEMQISLHIRDLPTLSTAIARLEQTPNIISVRRKA